MPKISKLFTRLLKSDVTVVAFGQLLQQAFTLLTGVLIGRFLGAGGYGVVNIARNIYTPIATLAPLGLDLALLKHIGRSEDDLPRVERLVARLRFVVAAINLPVAVIGGLVGGAWLTAHVYKFPHFEIMLFVTLMGLPIAADLAVLSAYYRGRHRPGAFALMTLYIQPVARLAMVGMAWYFFPNTLAVVTINTLQIAVSAVAVWTHHARWRALDAAAGGSVPKTPTTKADWQEVRVILGESSWMAINLFVYGMMRYTDILILGAFAPARVVGAYAALSTVSQLVQVWPLAASQTLGPTISKKYHAGDLAGVRSTLDSYIHLAAIMSGFLFGGIAAFGDQLDLIFGKSFAFRPDIALLLPLGYLISATLAPTGFALSMTGRHRAELGILLAGSVVLVGLCSLLIPPYGDIGAATAVCITFAAINITRFAYVSKTLGFIPGSLRDFAPPVLALIFALAAKLIVGMVLPKGIVGLLLGCVSYAAVFGVVTVFVLLTPETRGKLLGARS